MKKIVALSLLACLFAGCTSIEISSSNSMNGLDVKGTHEGNGERLISISSCGYYLFDRVPIVCSDMRWNGKKNEPAGGIAWFSDQGGVSEPYELLHKIAEKENCDLCNVICADSSRSKFELTSMQGLFAAIVNLTEVHVSAVLVPRNGAKAPAAVDFAK